MTGLWTNDRDALADGIWSHDGPYTTVLATLLAQYLIDSGVVRVLDPDDDELVERVATRLGWRAYIVRDVIEALRQP